VDRRLRVNGQIVSAQKLTPIKGITKVLALGGFDDNKPISHNNTSTDYFELARENGLSAETFFAEIGSLMLKIKEHIVEKGGYAYNKLNEEGRSDFVGISIDKGSGDEALDDLLHDKVLVYYFGARDG
jgi:hypothetical protein